MKKRPKPANRVNAAIMLSAVSIARLLKEARPADLYTNTTARLRWYSDVSRFADALRDISPSFNAVQFFDECGVPT